MARRKNLGRQKIKMEKIQNPNHLNVTFSKRRVGLFKKANELSVMCGVEVGLICFSPAGKAFSYGNPDLAHVMNRFENGGGSAIPNDHLNIELNHQLAVIERQLEAERKIGEEHDKRRESELSQCWWRRENRNQAGLEEVQQLGEAMEKLKQRLTDEAAKLQTAEATSAINATTNFPFNLYGNYPNSGSVNPFAAGTSTATSSFGNHHGSNYGSCPYGPF